MTDREFINKFTNDICLTDESISLEAKGFYYNSLISAYNKNNSLKQLINNSNEDKEYALKLIEELIMNGYFILGLPLEDGSIFKFSNINE